MMGVSSQILAILRGRTENFLSARCTIERQDETPIDEYGDRSHVWETVEEDVPCRIIYAGSRTGSAISEWANQEQMRDEYRLIVPFGTTLDTDYRVTLASGDVFDIVRIETLLTDDVFSAAILNRRV